MNDDHVRIEGIFHTPYTSLKGDVMDWNRKGIMTGDAAWTEGMSMHQA